MYVEFLVFEWTSFLIFFKKAYLLNSEEQKLNKLQLDRGNYIDERGLFHRIWVLGMLDGHSIEIQQKIGHIRHFGRLHMSDIGVCTQ